MSISFSRTHERQDAVQVFYPLSTVRCSGPVLFRDQLARDIACLLDIDDDVQTWSCQSLPLSDGSQIYRPDFHVKRTDISIVVDVRRPGIAPSWVPQRAHEAGFAYELIDATSIPFVRLKNARDLLRYARHEAALADRIRLLSALDEHSSLSVAEALLAFRETKPVAGLASLFLQRFVSMDLDDRLIGPETIVRRRRD